MNKKIKEIIKETLKDYTVEKIILFGSRARGNFDKYSDYDILISIVDDISYQTIVELEHVLRVNFAEINVAADVLIRNSSYINNVKDEIGNVISYALEEGIDL